MSFIDRLQFNQIQAEGNKPILLTDQKVWFVQAGKVDLFITRVMNDGITGRREYLFSVGPGDLFLGLPSHTVPEGEFGLLAVGHTGTTLLECDAQQLALIKDEPDRQEITDRLRHWTEKWEIAGIKADYQFDWAATLPFEQVAVFNQSAFTQALAMLLAKNQQEELRHKLKDEKDQSHMNTGLRG